MVSSAGMSISEQRLAKAVDHDFGVAIDLSANCHGPKSALRTRSTDVL